MPCLNEAEILIACIENARLGITQAGGGLIVDDGSPDGAIVIAEKLGAHVIHVRERSVEGYCG